MRVCFDTNVLVSAFATRGLCVDVLQLVLAEHELVVGERVLTELRRVLKRKMRAPDETIRDIEGFLRRQAQVVERASRPAIEVRDADDAHVLGEAIAGAVEVLVTGDQDLLDVGTGLPFRVLTPRGFWNYLRVHRGSEP